MINKFLLTNNIEKSDIILSVNKNLNDDKKSNVQSFAQLIKTPRKSVIARSQKQSDYIKALRENDIVLAVPSSGIHSNGFSLVRTILKTNKNSNSLKKEIIRPTKIYSKEVLKLNLLELNVV